MNNKNSITRNSSIELCRILAMFFIVMSHTYELGMGAWNYWSKLEGATYIPEVASQTFIACFFYFGVNIFLLISGYFLIKPTIQKFIKLYIAVAFYTLIGIVFHQYQVGEYNLWSIIIHTLIPFGIPSGGGYWFIECYMYLFLFAPILNKALKNMSDRELFAATALLGVINIYFGYFWQIPRIDGSGYCFVHFVFMYVLGHLIYKKQTNINSICHIKYYAIIVYVICAVLLFCMFYLSSDIHQFIIRTHCYSNPIVIIGAIAFFIPFTLVSTNNRIINTIATTVLGVYLLQGNRYFIHAIYETLQPYTNINLLVTFFIGFGLFIIGIAVDYLLQFIYRPISNVFIKIVTRYKKEK